MSDSEELIEDLPDAGDDLFGDGGDDDLEDVLSGSDRGGRALSDADLASDDENRRKDYDDEMRDDEEPTHREEKIMNVTLRRHPIPKSTDGQGQLKSFKVPPFLKFMPEEYNPDTFTPTDWDLKNAQSEHPLPVIRYRRDPATGKMQSNTNIYRWSDGSVTMAVGDEHYEISTKSLAPAPNKPYSEIQDAHYYAAAAHMHSNCLVVVGHLAEQYTARPNHAVQDDALEGFRRKMEEATKSKGDSLIIQTHEDPELAKRQAELAEKERNKAQRRRETAAAKMVEGTGSRYARGALSIGDLEGGRRGAGAAGRKRGAAGGPQSRKRNRNAEYDSDDDLPGGSGRHDEYVLDDFAVASDEEGSEGEDDEEEEILDDDDEEEEEAPKRKRQRTAEKEDADADAEADMDDDEAPAPSNRRRRRVVDDDEDED
ncbi:Leo1-like protein-domain-containing protein [Coniochaeta sp. 2T2.1]|nr:Leo1-like protein-domain-containing protein [Coniochaeta sp. 2T2.1]